MGLVWAGLAGKAALGFAPSVTHVRVERAEGSHGEAAAAATLIVLQGAADLPSVIAVHTAGLTRRTVCSGLLLGLLRITCGCVEPRICPCWRS